MSQSNFLTTFDQGASNCLAIFEYYFNKEIGTTQDQERAAKSNRDAFIGICNLSLPQKTIAKALIEVGKRHNVAFAIASSVTRVEWVFDTHDLVKNPRRVTLKRESSLSY